jgi:predicted Zn-dependent protease
MSRPHARWTLLPLLVIGLAAFACKSSDSSGGGGQTILLEDDTTTSEEPQGQRRRQPVLNTPAQDKKVGEEAARSVEAEMGLLDDPELSAYVSELGHRLLRGVPKRGFNYRFSIVDQFEPNAFALPGGQIYVSRGLLELSNSEDELACVIGHEITHAANRHSSASQAVQKRQSFFLMPYVRYAHMAAYSRDLERDADLGGQTLAGRAGYDPMGMSLFLSQLDSVERLRRGSSRLPRWFDTHPSSTERAAVNAARAPSIRVRENPKLSHDRGDFLRRIDGLVVGPNPSEGLFEGSRFRHPDLDFQVLFPRKWKYSNTHRAVGASSPDGQALVFLAAEGGITDPKQAAEERVAKAQQVRARITSAREVRIGDIDAYRIEVTGEMNGRRIAAEATFIPHGGLMYRIVGVAPTHSAKKFLPMARNTARSFRPLTQEERDAIKVQRVRIVEAKKDETLGALGKRTGNTWDTTRTAVLNGVTTNVRFDDGEAVKIIHNEPYTPKAKSELSSGFGGSSPDEL